MCSGKDTDMINCDDFIPTVIHRLKSCAVGQGLEVRTFKGDRSITVVKQNETMVWVREQGFVTADYPNIPLAKLKKLLKTLQKREFPRSNKLHTRTIDGDDV